MSPSYYTSIFGVDDDIYKMCRALSSYVENKKYSERIMYVGICPIVAPQSILDKGLCKAHKSIELVAGVASVFSNIDYEDYVSANISRKKGLIIKNVLTSVKSISARGKINYQAFESDVTKFCKENGIEIL